MSQTLLDQALEREIQRFKEPISVEDATDMLMGKTITGSIPKPAKRSTSKQKEERAAKIAALKAKRDGTDIVDDIPVMPGRDGDGSQADPIVEESEKELAKEDEEYLLSKFPEGTVLNDDQTLTLPDGRMIRKIQGAGDVQV